MLLCFSNVSGLQCSNSVGLGLMNGIDRYWGTSTPFDNLTAETLQYLTLKQSIADLTYFAKTVDLPFDTNHSSNADHAVSINSRPILLLLIPIAMGYLRRIIQRRSSSLD